MRTSYIHRGLPCDAWKSIERVHSTTSIEQSLDNFDALGSLFLHVPLKILALLRNVQIGKQQCNTTLAQQFGNIMRKFFQGRKG